MVCKYHLQPGWQFFYMSFISRGLFKHCLVTAFANYHHALALIFRIHLNHTSYTTVCCWVCTVLVSVRKQKHKWRYSKYFVNHYISETTYWWCLQSIEFCIPSYKYKPLSQTGAHCRPLLQQAGREFLVPDLRRACWEAGARGMSVEVMSSLSFLLSSLWTPYLPPATPLVSHDEDVFMCRQSLNVRKLF